MGVNTSKERLSSAKSVNERSASKSNNRRSSLRIKQNRGRHERQRPNQNSNLGDEANLTTQLEKLNLSPKAEHNYQKSAKLHKTTRKDVNGNQTVGTESYTVKKKKPFAPQPPSRSGIGQVQHLSTSTTHAYGISQQRGMSSYVKPASKPQTTLAPKPSSRNLPRLPPPPSKRSVSIERFKIPSDLITRLRRVPQFTSIPFGIVGIKQINTLNPALFTPLPFLPPLVSQPLPKSWSTIQQALKNVPVLCQQGHKAIDILFTTISSFNSNSQNESNFGMLNRPDVEQTLKVTLPFIAEKALQLPRLLEQPIPYLTNGESKTTFLNRKLCCSLLANAFFCAYYPHSLNDMPDINFFRLFNDTNSDRCEVKKEKLKCILNYFSQMHRLNANIQFQQQIISFERRCMAQKTIWETDNHKLCKISIEPVKKIEQANSMLQVDFANRMVGGGVLNDGSVMEEIRFSTCPELIVSRLFTQALDHNEVMVVTGTETFSEYTGYSTSFTYKGPTNIQWGKQPVDNFGRTYTQLVTMDATYFKRNEYAKQFRKQHIDRDLHKCKVAFQHGKAAISPIATGNWGCGAFNGNPELKFMIQWMAASHQDRPLMQYHINGNSVQGQSLLDMSSFLIQRNICVGQIYQVVLDYSAEVLEQQLDNPTTLFSYIKYRLGG